MAGTDKATANQLFGKISAYSTIVQQNLGKYLNKLSPYAKEYESTLDLYSTYFVRSDIVKSDLLLKYLKLLPATQVLVRQLNLGITEH